MENKKYLPVKIFHLILMAASIVLYAITLISFSRERSALNNISTVVNIAAMLAGIVYLAFGYKKKAHLCYKLFMWLFAISAIFQYVAIYRDAVSGPVYVTFVKFITFALIILLAGAKDYGAVKSNIISLAIVALNIFTLVDSCIFAADVFVNAGLSVPPLIFTSIGQLVLASTAAFMVCAKYLDKAERGAK